MTDTPTNIKQHTVMMFFDALCKNMGSLPPDTVGAFLSAFQNREMATNACCMLFIKYIYRMCQPGEVQDVTERSFFQYLPIFDSSREYLEHIRASISFDPNSVTTHDDNSWTAYLLRAIFQWWVWTPAIIKGDKLAEACFSLFKTMLSPRATLQVRSVFRLAKKIKLDNPFKEQVTAVYNSFTQLLMSKDKEQFPWAQQELPDTNGFIESTTIPILTSHAAIPYSMLPNEIVMSSEYKNEQLRTIPVSAFMWFLRPCVISQTAMYIIPQIMSRLCYPAKLTRSEYMTHIATLQYLLPYAYENGEPGLCSSTALKLSKLISPCCALPAPYGTRARHIRCSLVTESKARYSIYIKYILNHVGPRLFYPLEKHQIQHKRICVIETTDSSSGAIELAQLLNQQYPLGVSECEPLATIQKRILNVLFPKYCFDSPQTQEKTFNYLLSTTDTEIKEKLMCICNAYTDGVYNKTEVADFIHSLKVEDTDYSCPLMLPVAEIIAYVRTTDTNCNVLTDILNGILHDYTRCTMVIIGGDETIQSVNIALSRINTLRPNSIAFIPYSCSTGSQVHDSDVTIYKAHTDPVYRELIHSFSRLGNTIIFPSFSEQREDYAMSIKSGTQGLQEPVNMPHNPSKKMYESMSFASMVQLPFCYYAETALCWLSVPSLFLTCTNINREQMGPFPVISQVNFLTNGKETHASPGVSVDLIVDGKNVNAGTFNNSVNIAIRKFPDHSRDSHIKLRYARSYVVTKREFSVIVSIPGYDAPVVLQANGFQCGTTEDNAFSIRCDGILIMDVTTCNVCFGDESAAWCLASI